MINLAALVRLTIADDAVTYGKFFYVDFVRDKSYAAHHLEVEVGSEDTHMHLWVSTDEHNSGVITTQCDDCKTEPKWNLDESKTKDSLLDGKLF